MGALRFKLDSKGPFTDNNKSIPTPIGQIPGNCNSQLQYSSLAKTARIQKWLDMLIAPGSSLGGARPKANILDDDDHPWIAKFPSKADTIDKGAAGPTAYKYWH